MFNALIQLKIMERFHIECSGFLFGCLPEIVQGHLVGICINAIVQIAKEKEVCGVKSGD